MPAGSGQDAVTITQPLTQSALVMVVADPLHAQRPTVYVPMRIPPLEAWVLTMVSVVVTVAVW
jgi:hypothetical protein